MYPRYGEEKLYVNGIEPPKPDTCVFRWCTNAAITRVMVLVVGIEDEEDGHILIPVCNQHKRMAEKARDANQNQTQK